MGYIWFYTLAWYTGVQVDVYLSCISFCVSLVHFHRCITCVSLFVKLFCVCVCFCVTYVSVICVSDISRYDLLVCSYFIFLSGVVEYHYVASLFVCYVFTC